MTAEQTCRLSLIRSGAPRSDGSSLPGRSDDDLMLLARGGLGDAFDVLVRRHQNSVLNVAARLTGRSELAPDLAQNTFLAIYRALPQYQARGKFPAYLYRILLNQCRISYRSAHVENDAVLRFSYLPTELDDGAEDMILARERQREVELALDCLSPKLRRVVVLRYSGGLSCDEIGEVLSLPTGTVKRRIFDAMEKLRRKLGGTDAPR